MSKYLVIGGDRLFNAICDSVGMKADYVRRIVVDLQVGSAGRVYFDSFANDEVVDVIMQGGGITIVESPKDAAA